MKVNFDNLRRNLATDYNCVVGARDPEERDGALLDLRNDLVALLCVYDDGVARDCSCLVDEVELRVPARFADDFPEEEQHGW